jgi:flagellar biogenesis protein FliO
MAAPAQVDAIADAVAGDPVFAGLVVLLLLVVFLAYLFVRRTLLNMREGYEDAYGEK